MPVLPASVLCMLLFSSRTPVTIEGMPFAAVVTCPPTVRCCACSNPSDPCGRSLQLLPGCCCRPFCRDPCPLLLNQAKVASPASCSVCRPSSCVIFCMFPRNARRCLAVRRMITLSLLPAACVGWMCRYARATPHHSSQPCHAFLGARKNPTMDG
jgi:hypothetical protein